MIFNRDETVVAYGPIRLACRGECLRTDMDGIDNLKGPRRQGWTRIVKVEGTLMPLPHRWWTHLGTCPQCKDREDAEIQ